MEFRVDKLTVTIRDTRAGMVTVSAEDAVEPPSFKERAHSSSVAGYIDFSRQGSLDAPPRRSEPGANRPEPRFEHLPQPPTTSTPT